MTFRTRMRKLLKVLAASTAVILAAGVVYEQICERRDSERLPQVGQSVDVGGRSMNISCRGEGAPTVVFDSGVGEPGYEWVDIQAEVAKYTKACWFDRAGYGWSDAGPFPGRSAEMAKDLHALLTDSRIKGPYVLVGHSLGGLNARVYNGMYPEEVAGAVLVDAAHEDEPRRAPKFMLGRTAPRFFWRPIWIAAQCAKAVGLIRLVTPAPSVPDDPSNRTREQIVRALRRQPKMIATLADPSISESYAQAETAGDFGDRPLVVLTRGKMATRQSLTDMDREAEAYEQVWMHEIQPKLARLSTRGRQVIISSSGHDIPDESPAAVVAATREVVEAVRQAKPHGASEAVPISK
jgi:pimeloyl-ACP methyl ester carboxylesterase